MSYKNVNTVLIVLNVIYFIFLSLQGNTETDIEMMIKYGAMYAPLVQEGEWYRLLTSCFIHFGITHLTSNMLALFATGGIVEKILGHVRYLILYLASGLLGNVLSFMWDIKSGTYVVSAGASGAIFGVMGCLLCVALINRRNLDRSFIRRLGISIILNLYLGFSGGGVDNAAHVGGLVTGFILSFPMYLHSKDVLTG